MLKDYPHLRFTRCWSLSEETARNLGECVALIDCLSKIPIEPQLQQRLRRVSFQRGAQATTAIEGNTLTDDEVRKLLDGEPLPKSREYQAQEVKNAVEAMNHLWQRLVRDGKNGEVTPQLLCDMNRRIGQRLGPLYDGVPGKLRQDRRHVGRYLAPPPDKVPALLQDLCDWLRQEFGFHTGRQPMHSAIVQAVVAHVFFEWIHPFADGNGRTGRLLEFYILLRAGLPDIAAHVLANHYNSTRNEYAAHFENARQKRSLTDFLAYAVQGFVDGLRRTLDDVLDDTVRIVWRSHVYDVFGDYATRKVSVFKRRRALALELPPQNFTIEQLLQRSESLLKQYFDKDRRTLNADLAVLCELDLLHKEGEVYHPRFEKLSGCFSTRARRRQPPAM